MTLLVTFPQSHMHTSYPVICLKLIFTIPFRSYDNLISVRRKLVRQIGDNTLRPALFQTI